MDATTKYMIDKYREGRFFSEEDLVVVEFDLRIFINDVELVSILCTPKSLEPLVIGHLFSEGILDSLEDLGSIYIDEAAGTAKVTTKDKEKYHYIGETLYGRKTITTAGGGRKTIDCKDISMPGYFLDRIQIEPGEISSLVGQFVVKSDVFMDTGGVHGCALCDRNDIILFEDDIGRHNALDKVLGRALINGIATEDKFVITSGRVAEGMIKKVARAGIPFLVSRSAPTNSAIKMARKMNMTLIGFAREQRLNMYSPLRNEDESDESNA